MVAAVAVIYVIWVTILLIKISISWFIYLLYSSGDHKLLYSQAS